MTKEGIDRINQLAKKSRTPQGLTDAEKQEQVQLRAQYIADMRGSLRSQLENVVIVESDGQKVPLKKKEQPPVQ
ncbi:MAG: DUF896 domain-containing protein [Oscillospiraceae bacterium]|nr:DUF896 domain-containing protein [Oscillospiraceae bacterium]